MALRPVELPTGIPGRLLLGPMPGRFESWDSALAGAQRARVDLVLCLTPRDELAALSPRYFSAVATGRLPYRWLNTPMANYGLPPDLPAFREGIEDAAEALQRGEAVLLHCAAGLGRTGTAAACLLKRLGLPTDEALRRVREAGSNPENAVQSGLVDRF
jgi:hypothetical protein